MKSFTYLRRNAFLICLVLVFFSNVLSAQAPSIQWQKCFGGSDYDGNGSILQTTDGGYIVAGFTESSGGDVSGNHGFADAWVVKLNASGNIQWQKCLGGSGWDGAYSIQQTTDGGYIMVGGSFSNDGDVNGNHGSQDLWVVKLDASGSIQWQRCLGGSLDDFGTSIRQTTDGGYIVAGETQSNNGDVSGHHGNGIDYWVIKLNASGNIQWQKCLGGDANDIPNSIQQTTDGGYIVAGYTFSNNGDVSGNHGNDDYWVVKLNASGNIQWQKCLGGAEYDFAYSIQQTTDGGYIVVGGSNSHDADVSGNHGNDDCWVVKLNASGNIQWQKCYGGSDNEWANFIQQTTDGGYIVAATTLSNDGDVSGNHGTYDCWVVKLDASGNMRWQKCVGGSAWDVYGAASIQQMIQQTSDGGYIVGGQTSSNDGDVNGNHGYEDFWIVKLSGTVTGVTSGIVSPVNLNFQVYPNPANQNTLITFYLGQSKVVSVALFDILGQQVANITDKRLNNGNQTISWNTEKMAPGVYFIRLRTVNYEIAKKLVVIH